MPDALLTTTAQEYVLLQYLVPVYRSGGPTDKGTRTQLAHLSSTTSTVNALTMTTMSTMSDTANAANAATEPRDPFKSPATRNQKMFNGGIVVLNVLTIIAIEKVSDNVVDTDIAVPLAAALYVASVASDFAVIFYIRRKVVATADNTLLGDGSDDTVTTHDLKRVRKWLRSTCAAIALQLGYLLLVHILVYTRGMSMGPSFVPLFLLMWTCLNCFIAVLQPLFQLYILGFQPVGILERPFWIPPTPAAHWRRWRAKRAGRNTTVTSDAEAAQPLLASGDAAKGSLQEEESMERYKE